MNKYLKERLPSDLAQESKIYGRAPAGGAAFDPDEPAAAQLNLRPPSLPGGTAGKAVVMSILKEINSAPPPRSDMARAQSLSYQALPPFSSNVLAEYEVDGYGNEKEFLNKEKIFPLRAAVVKAKQVLQEHDRNFKMKDFFGGNSTEQVKAKVKKEQDDPGKAFFFLNEAHRELVAAEKYLDQEPSKRWKAHYYYVLARLKTHLISVLEYNTMLAQIRTDSLPELPMGAVGFRIASKERPSCRKGEVRTWRRELDELWPKIINDFPETPWAILAKREKDTALGMEWRPAQN